MSDYTPDVQLDPELEEFQVQINAEQQKINEAYTQIGKAYYEGHPSNYDPAYEPYYASIRTSYDTVVALRNQILAAQGMQACPNCGYEMPQGLRFCSECGTPIYVEEAQASICKRCGEPLTEGAKFCTKCGQPVETVQETLYAEPEPLLDYAPQATLPDTPEEAPQETAEYAPETAPVSTCPGCGAELIPGTAFCTNCGQRIVNAEAPSAPAADVPAFCTGCGSPLTPGSAFCTNCGQSIL